MLVVTREDKDGKRGFWIGPAFVRVLKAVNGKVRIGIEAPEEFEICREEVIEKYGKPANPLAVKGGSVSANVDSE